MIEEIKIDKEREITREIHEVGDEVMWSYYCFSDNILKRTDEKTQYYGYDE